MVFFKSCAVVVFLIELILFRKSFEQSKIVYSGWKIRPDPAPNPLQTSVYLYQTSIPTCRPHRKGAQPHNRSLSALEEVAIPKERETLGP